MGLDLSHQSAPFPLMSDRSLRVATLFSLDAAEPSVLARQGKLCYTSKEENSLMESSDLWDH
jgi:hypothetical protein